MVYTVVSSNPKTHTFEVRHPISGQTKVVHRNLLLCVSFLTVLPEDTKSASQISSCASEPDCASLTIPCDSDEKEDVNFSSEQFIPDCTVDHTACTQNWVSQIPLVDTHHLAKALVPPADACVTDNICENVNANVSS